MLLHHKPPCATKSLKEKIVCRKPPKIDGKNHPIFFKGVSSIPLLKGAIFILVTPLNKGDFLPSYELPIVSNTMYNVWR